MDENLVVRFFRLKDEAERSGVLPTSHEDLMVLARPPAVSSEAARHSPPELVQRLLRLHRGACSAARAAGY